MSTRSISSLKSATGRPANVKYTEYIGDQTRSYSNTISMKKLFDQSTRLIKPFVRYT